MILYFNFGKEVDYMPNQNPPGRGMAIASLVLGIVSVVFFWLSFANLIALICGIAGIICAGKARKLMMSVGAPSGMATAGLVLSIIGTILSGIGFFTCTVCVLCAAGSASAADWASMMDSLQ